MEWRTVGLLIPHHTWPCNDSFSFYFFTATVVEHFPCTFLVFGACGDEILIGEREKRVVLRDGDKMSLTLVS